MNYKKQLFTLLALVISLTVFGQRTFVHPGLAHKQSDFDRMKAMVDAKIDPWYTSYVNLTKENNAKYTYSVRGNSSITKVVMDGENYSALASDVRASYMNALMWMVTGDERHAQKAVEIFNAWQNLTNFQAGGTTALDAGRITWILIEAAEIIKSTYTGWAAADIQKFKDMLVYPGYSSTEKPSGSTTFYWKVYMGDSGRHGNQDLFGWRVVMAMGVFLDNEIMYDRAYRYFTNQKSRPDDLNYEPGPPITSASPSATNEYFDTYNRSGQRNDSIDYGYNGVLPYFIWENGQCQESSRDQDHASLGLGLITSMAEIAWNQGDDIYSMFNNRILTGYEWALRYNISYEYSFPDQTQPWEPAGYTTNEGEATLENNLFIQRRDRSGRWYSKKPNPHYEGDLVGISRGNFKSNKRPVYEITYAHYKVRAGMSDEALKWTKRAMDISNAEFECEKTGWSLDHLGWGGLTCHRMEWMTGDPVTFASGEKVFGLPVAPCTINAVDYDYFTGNGQGRTYSDQTTTNQGNKYRTDEAVDITEGDGGYVIYNMQQGEWMSYTIGIPRNGFYDLKVRHETTATGAKLRIVFDNDEEAEAELPVTSGYEETTIGLFTLTQGCKVMRIYVTGTDNITSLSSIAIQQDESGAKAIKVNGSLKTNQTADLTWTYWNTDPATVSVYRNTTPDFQSATMISTNLTDNTYTDATVSGTDNSYYYWIVNEENISTIVKSDSILLSWGYFYDEFADEASSWRVSTGTGAIVNDKLEISYASNNNTGIINRDLGVVLHAGNYPILAMQVDLPADVDLRIYNASTSILGGASNTYTRVLNGNVYYYDLTQVGFVRGSTTTMVPVDDIMANNTFNVRLIANGTTETSKLSWIGTFSSLEELQEFAPVSIHEPVSEGKLKYYVRNGVLYLNEVPNQTLLQAYNLNGQLLLQQTIAGNEAIQLPQKGFYVIKLKGNNCNETLKVIAD